MLRVNEVCICERIKFIQSSFKNIKFKIIQTYVETSFEKNLNFAIEKRVGWIERMLFHAHAKERMRQHTKKMSIKIILKVWLWMHGWVYVCKNLWEQASVNEYACTNDWLYAFTYQRGRMHVCLCTVHICMRACIMCVSVLFREFFCLSVSVLVFHVSLCDWVRVNGRMNIL